MGRRLIFFIMICWAGVSGAGALERGFSPFARLQLRGPLLAAELTRQPGNVSYNDFLSLLTVSDPLYIKDFSEKLEGQWTPEFIPMILETMNYTINPGALAALQELLVRKTGRSDLHGLTEWYQWLWNRPRQTRADYGAFKASLYKHFDPRFEHYFKDRQRTAQIRLDEIRWGGVRQDGIPPLRQPKMIPAGAADYLAEDNIVFGVEVDGDARAYPKRILAWHEMFTDTFGSGDSHQPIAGVYCTLCGTVIIYRTHHGGVDYQLGTSGFLYRSNKLMYDKGTQSLWSMFRGEPVLGPLAGKGIVLERYSVVTTTWGEWRRRHPGTTVLSLATGYRRDYSEGAAYRDYFATDRLMFHSPFNDLRLANKEEVLALRFPADPTEQLAIATSFLIRHPVYHDRIGMQKFVVLTDRSGANRVYAPGSVIFNHYDLADLVVDSSGRTWRVTEEALLAGDGRRLERLPCHRAFWFGWHAAFPETRLIK